MYELKSLSAIYLRGMLRIVFALAFGSTPSWGQSVSNCQLTMDPGGSFDSPQAALNAASAYWGYPFYALNEAQVCKGQWIKAEWFLDQPIPGDTGITIWPFIGKAVQGFCDVASDGSVHVVSTRDELFGVYVAARCSGAASATSIALTGPTETRPAGTGGSSAVIITAKVTDSANPKPGVVVSFSVDVTANSGGHDHDDASRPKGGLSVPQGTTDANGEIRLTFTAPQLAGVHTIKAICGGCSNSPASKEIQVKVPDLVEMLADTAKPATYTLVGATGNHKSNHWFTSSAGGVLQKVTDAMFKTGWGSVGVNDGSLLWGGLFDIKGGWTPSHQEHRMGTEVDISVTNPSKATDEQKKKTYAELCKKDNTALSIQTLWHQDDGYPEHFHMYLDGTGLTSQAGGGPCCTHYKTTRPKMDKKTGKPVLDTNGKSVQENVALCEETSPR